jgi:hypothetical protein
MHSCTCKLFLALLQQGSGSTARVCTHWTKYNDALLFPSRLRISKSGKFWKCNGNVMNRTGQTAGGLAKQKEGSPKAQAVTPSAGATVHVPSAGREGARHSPVYRPGSATWSGGRWCVPERGRRSWGRTRWWPPPWRRTAPPAGLQHTRRDNKQSVPRDSQSWETARFKHTPNVRKRNLH